MSVRKEYPFCTFCDGTLTIKDYVSNGKVIDYLYFRDVVYEVEKDFKNQIKRLKFGPFIKGFISQEIDDEYSDGTPKSYTEEFNLFTPLEIFQAPNSIEEYIVDERNEIYESRNGFLYFKGTNRVISIPPAKKEIRLSKEDTFVDPKTTICLGKGQKIVVENSRQVKELDDAKDRVWYEEKYYFDLELKDHENELIIFLSPDGKVCYGATRTEENGRLVIPEGVEEIYPDAFRMNIKIKELVLPKSLRVIGVNAFIGAQINKVTFPDGLEKIGHSAFEYNDLLSLSLPDSIEIINESSFAHNENLKEVKLPNKLKKIERYAFYFAKFKTLKVPASIERIEGEAFDYSKLEIIHFEGSKAQWEKVKYFDGQRDIKIEFE